MRFVFRCIWLERDRPAITKWRRSVADVVINFRSSTDLHGCSRLRSAGHRCLAVDRRCRLLVRSVHGPRSSQRAHHRPSGRRPSTHWRQRKRQEDRFQSGTDSGTRVERKSPPVLGGKSLALKRRHRGSFQRPAARFRWNADDGTPPARLVIWIDVRRLPDRVQRRSARPDPGHHHGRVSRHDAADERGDDRQGLERVVDSGVDPRRLIVVYAVACRRRA